MNSGYLDWDSWEEAANVALDENREFLDAMADRLEQKYGEFL